MRTARLSATPLRPAESRLPGETENKRGETRVKPPALQSLGDLLRTVYGRKRRSLNLKKTEIGAICSVPKVETVERDELLGLAASDRTLERTRELMLLSMERFDAATVGGQLWEFVRDVLHRHPAFAAESLAWLLENQPDAPSEERAVRTLTSQSFATLRWPEGLTALKKKEMEQCRLNALWCLLLWFRKTRGTSFERIQRYLHTNIWAPAARHQNTDLRKLRVLMTNRQHAAIAVACSMLEKEAFEQREQADASRMAEERAIMHAKELEEKIASTNTQIEAAKAQIEQLERDVSSARSAHENEKAHMRNDYEELRGRVLRRLREELALLDEGLHALRRDPPKVHVMEDHAERAIDGLKGEMKRLKQSEGKGDD